MEHLISIVVPVYNSQQYLSNCLDSILNQTYHNLEIVLVNDGSTDNSLNILEEYQKKDKRIKIISTENHGVSHARNVGIQNVTGDYITFVDSDDILEIDTIETLYKDIIDNNADLVQCNHYINEYEYFYTYDNITINGDKEVFHKFLVESICCTVWGKLYKKEVFNSVSFNEYYNNHEDELFQFDIIKNCKVVVLEQKRMYHYYWNRKGSLTNKNTNNKDIELFTVLFNKVLKYTKDNYQDLFDDAYQFIIRKLNYLKELKRDLSIEDFDLDDIDSDVIKIIKEFLNIKE